MDSVVLTRCYSLANMTCSSEHLSGLHVSLYHCITQTQKYHQAQHNAYHTLSNLIHMCSCLRTYSTLPSIFPAGLPTQIWLVKHGSWGGEAHFLLCFWGADQTQHGYWVICTPTHINPLTPHTHSPTHLNTWTPTESICSWKVNYTLQVLSITHTHTLSSGSTHGICSSTQRRLSCKFFSPLVKSL